MKRAIFNLSLIVLIFGCKDESKNHCHAVSSYIEINELVKQVVKADTTFKSNKIDYTLYSADGIFQVGNLYDSVQLSNDDLKFMKFQDSIFAQTHLHPEIFQEYKLINSDSIGGMYRTYSVPLLTLDKRYLFIEIGYHVGVTGGTGYLVVFEKNDGNWVEKHRFFRWLS